MSVLAACVSCRRHVRIDEEQCPFCGARGRSAAPEVVTARLSRSRLVALATSIGAAAVVSGCPATQHPMYGAPPSPTTETDAAPPAQDDAATPADDAAASAPTTHPPIALYGAPPMPAPK